MKTRIEQDPDTGDIFILLPEELIEDYQLEIGDTLTLDFDEDEIRLII